MAVDERGRTTRWRRQRIESSGFDLSGLDFHTGGTLEKNFSFYVLPSSDNTASFHFETVMGRLDNVFGSSWLNVKLGKFELDNLLSEKRILTLTANGGIYQTYHFIPVGDNNYLRPDRRQPTRRRSTWDTRWTIGHGFPLPLSVRVTETWA